MPRNNGVKGVWVKVKREDITNGCRKCPDECPVALALRRVFSEPISICDTGLFNGRFSSPELPLPTAVRKFTARFDDGLRVRPFKFFLPLN